MIGKNHFKIISIILFIIICLIYLLTNCKSTIFNKPIWPCPYNVNRLKNLYIKESQLSFRNLQILINISKYFNFSNYLD